MATTYDPPKANVTTMIRNSLFRSGVVGQSLQEKYGKITDKEVVDILQNQITELSNNNVTLSSIDTIAQRISNNVFALARLMQKMYELKVRERILNDRERSRREAFQEEAQFEALNETRDNETTEYRRIRRKNDTTLFDVLKTIAAVGSLAALGFKDKVEGFLEKANTWFDETFNEAKNSFETFIEDARNYIDQTIDGYIDESSEEVKLNREEDVETERIVNEINTQLEDEDRKIDAFLGLEEVEERDVSDSSPPDKIELEPDVYSVDTSESDSGVRTSEPVARPAVSTSLSPNEKGREVAPQPPVEPLQPQSIGTEPVNTSAKPLVIPSDEQVPSLGTITPPTSNYSPPPASSALNAPTASMSTPTSSAMPRSFAESISRPSMLSSNVSGPVELPASQSQSYSQQNFRDVMRNIGVTPTSLDAPQMSTPVTSSMNQNTPQLGKIIGETSYNNQFSKNYTPSQNDNTTTILSSNNLDAARPAVEHFVPSPIANRGSLEIGVRFNATG